MKEIIGKAKHSKKLNFPWKSKIGNKTKTCKDEKANEFNKYVGPSLVKNIPNFSIPLESFLKRVNTTLSSQSLSINELKDAFFSLKTNKSPDADKIKFNVIKHCFGDLCVPLSLQSGVFSDLMNIAIVSPVFKPVILRKLAIIAQFLFFLDYQKSFNA